MPIPSLPTDNIYKFMAIGGIILLLTGHFASFSAGTRTQELAAQVIQAKAIAEIYAKTDSQKAELALAESMGAEAEWEFLLRAKWGYLAWLEFTFWAGLLLSITGFVLWYFRVQRHLDKLLVAQTKHLRNDK